MYNSPYQYIKKIVESQVNIIVQPVNAEAAEHPRKMSDEASALAFSAGKPVVLMVEGKPSVTFQPES